MTKAEWINLAISGSALAISVLSVIFVFLRVRLQRRQLFLDNYFRILDINKHLISLGFSDPDLFNVIEGKAIASGAKQRRYIQLWVNHAALIYSAYQYGALGKSAWSAIRSDLRDLFALEGVRIHWRKVEIYYSKDMRAFVEELFEEAVEVPTQTSSRETTALSKESSLGEDLEERPLLEEIFRVLVRSVTRSRSSQGQDNS